MQRHAPMCCHVRIYAFPEYLILAAIVVRNAAISCTSTYVTIALLFFFRFKIHEACANNDAKRQGWLRLDGQTKVRSLITKHLKLKTSSSNSLSWKQRPRAACFKLVTLRICIAKYGRQTHFPTRILTRLKSSGAPQSNATKQSRFRRRASRQIETAAN